MPDLCLWFLFLPRCLSCLCFSSSSSSRCFRLSSSSFLVLVLFTPSSLLSSLSLIPVSTLLSLTPRHCPCSYLLFVVLFPSTSFCLLSLLNVLSFEETTTRGRGKRGDKDNIEGTKRRREQEQERGGEDKDEKTRTRTRIKTRTRVRGQGQKQEGEETRRPGQSEEDGGEKGTKTRGQEGG